MGRGQGIATEGPAAPEVSDNKIGLNAAGVARADGLGDDVQVDAPADPGIRSAFAKGDQLHSACDEAIGSVHPLSFAAPAGAPLAILSVAAPRGGAAACTVSRP